MQTKEMIATHPDVRGNVNQALVDAIDAAYACAQTCTSCADACLAEDMVAQLRQCIRLNLDCADVCDAAATLGSRRTGSNEEVFEFLEGSLKNRELWMIHLFADPRFEPCRGDKRFGELLKRVGVS